MGDDFMDFLSAFQKPKLTPSRKLPGGNSGYRTWGCSRGGYKGRCYRDPNDEDDIIYVPVGLEENTFDYNRSGYSEGEQFGLWLCDNLTSHTPDAGSTTWSWIYQTTETTTTTDPATGESTTSTTTTDNPDSGDSGPWTSFQVDCPNNNVPVHDCWDKYMRASGAPSDAPLDVYCGWDVNGNPIPGKRFWEITGPGPAAGGGFAFEGAHQAPTGVYNPFCNDCANNASNPIFGGFLSFLIQPSVNIPPCVGLEYVSDASIAIDPTRIDGFKRRKL